MLPASLTWRFQFIDVAVAARVKGELYNLWCSWMANTVLKKKYRAKSWNYIAPGKHDLVDWCLQAWAKVGGMKNLIQAGCNATYMTLDEDEAMAKFDGYTQLVDQEDDFDRHDWASEVANKTKLELENFARSSFNWLVDLDTKEKKKWV